jgi:fatty acid desaturase
MMGKARSLFSADELASLRRKSGWRGAWLVAHAWLVILATMAACAFWPNPLTILLGILIIGGRQLGLAILMHDAAHGLLLEDPRRNDRAGEWLCAYPVIADLARYRPYHLTHHRHVQSALDPDLALSAPFPTSGTSFRRKMLRDLTGQTAFKQRRALVLGALGPSDQPAARRLAHLWQRLHGPILTNLGLFAGLAFADFWWLYPVLWLLPLATVYQAVSRIRNIAEHAMVSDDGDVLRNARTTYAGPLARLLVAPYWVNFHLEHHLAMFVPCYNLPLAHRLLIGKGLGPRLETQPSYPALLRLATAKAARAAA